MSSPSPEVWLRCSPGSEDGGRSDPPDHVELPPDKFHEYSNAIHARVSQLIVHGSDSSERMGGILALDRLIDVDGDDAAQKTTRFAGYLRTVFRGNDNAAMIVAARALGKLAVPAGSLTADLVEAEVKSALEWLQSDRQENRRFAAILILRELARHSPTMVYAFVPQIFDVIWVGLRDPKVLIRESAAEAVGACFDIIAARDAPMRLEWFSRVYEEALRGFQMASLEAIHGSLLTLQELLRRGGMFMNDHYRHVCNIVSRYKSHRDLLIRRQVVALIPTLASYSPTDFVDNHLPKFMNHLEAELNKEKDRNPALIAVGQVASAIGSSINPYLPTILAYVKKALEWKA